MGLIQNFVRNALIDCKVYIKPKVFCIDCLTRNKSMTITTDYNDLVLLGFKK